MTKVYHSMITPEHTWYVGGKNIKHLFLLQNSLLLFVLSITHLEKCLAVDSFMILRLVAFCLMIWTEEADLIPFPIVYEALKIALKSSGVGN